MSYPMWSPENKARVAGAESWGTIGAAEVRHIPLYFSYIVFSNRDVFELLNVPSGEKLHELRDFYGITSVNEATTLTKFVMKGLFTQRLVLTSY